MSLHGNANGDRDRGVLTGAETSRTGVIGHRGASSDRPENTIASFDEALRQGCDAIELDLRLSADSVPVVIHDRTLEKAGMPGRPVCDLSLSELRDLDLGGWFDVRYAGEAMPTLDQVLERYAARTLLLLELKDEENESRNRELAREVTDRVSRQAAEESVFVLSFECSLLDAVEEMMPGLPRVLNLRPPPSPGGDLEERIRGLSALSVDVRTLAPDFGLAVRNAGLPLWAYTCNGPRRLNRALAAGATAVISDRPGWLVECLTKGGGS
jgi:glycerophosphoryl diester phosphodiesterase